MVRVKRNTGRTIKKIQLPRVRLDRETAIDYYPVQVGNILRTVRSIESRLGQESIPLKEFNIWRIICGSTNASSLVINQEHNLFTQIEFLKKFLAIYLEVEVRFNGEKFPARMVKSDVPIYLGEQAFKLIMSSKKFCRKATQSTVPHEVASSLTSQAYRF